MVQFYIRTPSVDENIKRTTDIRLFRYSIVWRYFTALNKCFLRAKTFTTMTIIIF